MKIRRTLYSHPHLFYLLKFIQFFEKMSCICSIFSKKTYCIYILLIKIQTFQKSINCAIFSSRKNSFVYDYIFWIHFYIILISMFNIIYYYFSFRLFNERTTRLFDMKYKKEKITLRNSLFTNFCVFGKIY